MSVKKIIVAIDGPAGAGKSTLARRVAARLGYLYINTGALYRAVALWALRLGTELSDMHRLGQLAKEAVIHLTPDGRTFLNGEDVSEPIRTPEVAEAASQVSAVPEVRRALLIIQRQMAESASVVMEGRDIATVVFPNAHVKIFLDADPDERARRRSEEFAGSGHPAELEKVKQEIETRDRNDRRRQEAPLIQAPDAQLVDTTGLSIDQVEEEILKIVRARTSNGKSTAAE